MPCSAITCLLRRAAGWTRRAGNGLQAAGGLGIRRDIRAEGGLRSADFDNTKPGGGWWNWKEEKIALEQLFTAGDLMMARRDKFQRVYDLPERVLPGWDDARRHQRSRAARTGAAPRGPGLARPGWVWDYYRLPRNAAPTAARTGFAT